MTADELLDKLIEHGLSCELDGERLLVSPARLMTTELSAEIRQHKPGLMALLRPATPEDEKLVEAVGKIPADASGVGWLVERPGGKVEAVVDERRAGKKCEICGRIVMMTMGEMVNKHCGFGSAPVVCDRHPKRVKVSL